MAFDVIVPARHGSSRLPGKALADIGGRPMLVRVLERAAQSGAARVVAAVDSPALREAAISYGFDAILTGSCANGTERVAAAAARLASGGVVVNVQCDEPFISPTTIAACARLGGKARYCATVATPVAAGDMNDPDVVKVVLNSASRAMYFSRAPIPHERVRDQDAAPAALAHIGIYSFSCAAILRELSELPACAPERIEQLEQLRWLWHGYEIDVATVGECSRGIDTPGDLARARSLPEAS